MEGAFGAGKAQGFGFAFDPMEFIKRPTTILRLVSWFFSIIVFGCVSGPGGHIEGENGPLCIMNGDSGACNFGIFVGVVGFLGCIVFLILDVLFDKMSSVQHRKFVVLGDLGFSAAWAFFNFVAFCYMTNKWTTTSQDFITKNEIAGWQKSNVGASIAFSFFSIATFGVLAFFAFQKYRSGIQFESSDKIENEVAGQTSYPGYPGGQDIDGGGYQQAPFQSGDLSGGNQQYQQPSY